MEELQRATSLLLNSLVPGSLQPLVSQQSHRFPGPPKLLDQKLGTKSVISNRSPGGRGEAQIPEPKSKTSDIKAAVFPGGHEAGTFFLKGDHLFLGQLL